jgi:D-alanyl-D-alanine carboxypeptidase (penicillin-binding protein 5/6)
MEGWTVKRTVCAILAAIMLAAPACAIDTLSGDDIEIAAPSAVLMEKQSGEVIYEKDAHRRMAPASVTKVMTLLLIAEALENGDIGLDDMVTASARAASFGGSCVFLKEGEQLSVSDMLKCIAVVSANDCAVAMAEYLCGTEQAFVDKMNQRAAQLGLKDTNFKNCTGLFDDPEHYTSAYDIAVMSRELIKHDLIKKYTTIWMDSIRGGAFGLSSTNKLVYYYPGCTGLKTGFTEKAGYCLSATAQRDGVEYIAVIMDGATSASRNEDAKTLLNYAFANYALCPLRQSAALPPVLVELGTADAVQPVYSGPEAVLIPKQGSAKVEYSLDLPESVKAPVKQGDILGSLTVRLDGKELARVPIAASNAVERLTSAGIFLRLAKLMCGVQNRASA